MTFIMDNAIAIDLLEFYKWCAYAYKIVFFLLLLQKFEYHSDSQSFFISKLRNNPDRRNYYSIMYHFEVRIEQQRF